MTCWGTGAPLREFLHVDDLGDASVFTLERWDPSADDSPKDQQRKPLSFLNVGTGIELSICQLADAVAAATGFSGRINWDTSKPDGTPKKLLDVSRMKALGWQAKISLQDGLDDAIQAFVNSKK